MLSAAEMPLVPILYLSLSPFLSAYYLVSLSEDLSILLNGGR